MRTDSSWRCGAHRSSVPGLSRGLRVIPKPLRPEVHADASRPGRRSRASRSTGVCCAARRAMELQLVDPDAGAHGSVRVLTRCIPFMSCEVRSERSNSGSAKRRIYDARQWRVLRSCVARARDSVVGRCAILQDANVGSTPVHAFQGLKARFSCIPETVARGGAAPPAPSDDTRVTGPTCPVSFVLQDARRSASFHIR